MINIKKFWEAALAQDAEKLRSFFAQDASVNWHCTNEQFSVEEYIRANCEYPGDWDGAIERTEKIGDLLITAARVYPRENPEQPENVSFHVVSFFQIRDGKIVALDEYWGDDQSAPQWRLDKQIGKKIR